MTESSFRRELGLNPAVAAHTIIVFGPHGRRAEDCRPRW
jgi:hypothetical protein